MSHDGSADFTGNEVYEAPSPIHGMGIFAARDFAQGERVVRIDDSRVVPDGSPDIDAGGQRLYYDDISSGRVVQLGPLQYTNHCCDFSTYTRTIDGIRYRVARRDIRTGEEITSHYCINAHFSGTWECHCGSANCLRFLTHDYFALPRHLRHLHDFAREVHLTEDEWFRGIDFLTRVGHACSETRQEFILLSDTLGLSQLVVAQNHRRDPEATEQTVFGPFHVEGATALPDGANIAEAVEGEPLFVQARVVSIDGEPIAGATVDVWHADAEGLYDLQDPNWSPDHMKLRGVFTTDVDGRFGFQTIMPCAYPVPTDGPVGEMLSSANRQAMRPAHIHFRVAAPGYDTLITHVFVEGDPWLESDAVFGVRASCVARFEQHEVGKPLPNGTEASTRFHTLDYTFRLQPLD